MKERTWADLTHDEKQWVCGYGLGGIPVAGVRLEFDRLAMDPAELKERIQMEEDLGWWKDTTTTIEEWRASHNPNKETNDHE
jgi:hypothetical protein